MSLREAFHALAAELDALLRPGEVYTALLEGETSDFVRLNRNRVRQAGSVRQLELHLDLIEGQRHATGRTTLSGDPAADRPVLAELVAGLRAVRADVAEDPHLLYATEVRSSEHVGPDGLPDAATALGEVIRAADGLDLVGLWSSGRIYRGFANALGQRNWYENASFHLDWSLYHREDKAVKGSYAGLAWEPAELARRMEQARTQLQAVARPPKRLKPGACRAYLAPAALAELLTVLSWGGFGLKSHRTGQTPLIRMVRQGQRLHPAVTLAEDHAGGLAPPFTAGGFIKPERVTLVEHGAYKDTLVDPRSGKEYGVPVNAGSEFPEALTLSPGELPEAEVLTRLERGVYLGNLWYANFSDRSACRLTGMTRYACFWVEDGRIRAPLEAMRFDESLYRMLGEGLLGLTRERELLPDTGTYFQRSTSHMLLPGFLTEAFTFTL